MSAKTIALFAEYRARKHGRRCPCGKLIVVEPALGDVFAAHCQDCGGARGHGVTEREALEAYELVRSGRAAYAVKG